MTGCRPQRRFEYLKDWEASQQFVPNHVLVEDECEIFERDVGWWGTFNDEIRLAKGHDVPNTVPNLS